MKMLFSECVEQNSDKPCKHGRYPVVSCHECYPELLRNERIRLAHRKAVKRITILFLVGSAICTYVLLDYLWSQQPKYRIVVRNEGDTDRYVIQHRVLLIPGYYRFMWNHSHFSLEEALKDRQKMLDQEAYADYINNLKWKVVKP